MRKKLGILVLLALSCSFVATTSLQAVDFCAICYRACQHIYDQCVAQQGGDCDASFDSCMISCDDGPCH